jgi:hypothetical protein
VFFPVAWLPLWTTAKGLLTQQKFTHFYVLGHKMPHLHLPTFWRPNLNWSNIISKLWQWALKPAH